MSESIWDTETATHTDECRELVRASLDDNLALDYSNDAILAMTISGEWEARLDEQMTHVDLCYCDY